MKELYCKYCGMELERGSCNCEQFLHSTKSSIKRKKICDTCDKRIDIDAVYCPYCGVPFSTDGDIDSLKRELRGENAVDVLDIYEKIDKENGIKRSKVKKNPFTVLFSLILIILIGAVSFTSFLLPVIRKRIEDYQLKKTLETAEQKDELLLTPTSDKVIQYEPEPTTQPVIELRDTWVKRDGYFYAFDKNGDPIVADWVTETNEDGEEQQYYFDIEGKLVVNSWIDGEYYVGSDGAMLKNQETPDGAFVDEDGRVLLHGNEEVAVERETYVYYEAPNSSETVSATTQKSALTGEIKGVDPTKTYELYIKNIRQERDSITKGDLKCNITFYVPIIAGAKEKEVDKINAAILTAIEEEFKPQIKEMAKGYGEIPKSITFTSVEQRNLTSNKMTILTHGKVLPRKGLTEKKKFRFVYDRKSGQLKVANISE